MTIAKRSTAWVIAFVSYLVFATFVGAGISKADGYLTPGEQSLADAVASGICNYIDNNGVTISSMTSIFDVIYPQPEIANGGDVADVVNYSVKNYCPEHWRELVSFGSAARGS